LRQHLYRVLISGQEKGVCWSAIRLFLRIFSAGYGLVVFLRNLAYNRGIFKSHKAGAVVLSVGNITAGGTGKTPFVIWLYKQIISNFKSQISNLKSQISNSKCAILTRGYKSIQDPRLKTQKHTDEVEILMTGCADAEVIVNPDRVAAAAEAVEKYGAGVLILDDGFQHRRLARDIDIVTIDASCPFGYGRLLPAGLLREPTSSLKRADAAVITRCDQVDKDRLSRLEQELLQINPDMIIARSVHAAVCVRPADGDRIDIERLKGKKTFAFCGIGNPPAFFKTVKGLGCELAGSKVYNDHVRYRDKDMKEICSKAADSGAELILTTQKDWTKIGFEDVAGKGITFAYLEIELEVTSGGDELKELIEKGLAGKIQHN